MIPCGIALDSAAGKMYWTDAGTDKIQRANLDGSGVEDLITSGLRSPYGIALDLAAGKMYWTKRIVIKIRRSFWFDGSRVEAEIQRANLDGSEVEDLVTSGLNGPYGLALDTAADKMYWADRYMNKIQRANLNGTEVEDLVPHIPAGFTGVTLRHSGTAWGVPQRYTADSSKGVVAYMLLGTLKGCAFADAEADRQTIVYVKIERLGHLSGYESNAVCRASSRTWNSWDGQRITHLRFF